MSIIAIAAVDANWGIGYQGELLEHIPADMKFFKETTMDGMVVMGRNTWNSLPESKRPLEGRQNVVISSKENIIFPNPVFLKLETFLDVIIAFYHQYREMMEYDIYIIGGASIYKQLLPYCDKAYITKIYKSHENVDSYFPNLDQLEDEWELTEESSPAEYKDFYYSFATYERKVDFLKNL